jgi:hypothetical protein
MVLLRWPRHCTCLHGQVISISHCHCILLTVIGIISLTHIHKEPAGRIRIRKWYRLCNRLAVCAILICLPIANDLNSLSLISITTSLLAYVLIVELWGSTCKGDSIFGEGQKCNYTAKCKISKKDLESAVKHGHVIRVQELSDRGEKGFYDLS